ncbi:hypothetical protein G3I28_32840, partial [Streptomyces sp. SID10116]|nr:hypothetical protein [Streptomyces sp. SID10116]
RPAARRRAPARRRSRSPRREIVWCDDEGVTCRRWNWRQGPRTRLTEESVNAVFLLEGMGPDAGLDAACAELAGLLAQFSPGADVTVR